jgi:hypothetical protein
VLAGCSGAGQPTDEQQIEAVYRALAKAESSRNVAEIRRMIPPTYYIEISGGSRINVGKEQESLERNLKRYARYETMYRPLRVRVQGDRAEVDVYAHTNWDVRQGDEIATFQSGNTRVDHWKKQNGRWTIDWTYSMSGGMVLPVDHKPAPGSKAPPTPGTSPKNPAED